MKNNVIIALDFKTKEQSSEFLLNFSKLKEKPYLKIGMELFYKCGIEYVKKLKKDGYKIFLDLKIFDIPQTVYNTIYNVVSNVEVDIINVHALGLKNMLKQAKKAIVDAKVKTKLISVTLLTSLNENDLQEQLNLNTSFETIFKNLINLSVESNLDGVVCSCQDLKYKINVPKGFIFVTPGIRTLSDNLYDQSRIATPKKAAKLNATYIVIGRPITKSSNPYLKYLKILNEFNDNL